MKTTVTSLALLVTLAAASTAHAQAPSNAEPSTQRPLAASSIALPKDPLVAMYFSATLPGLGQIYTGHKVRGVVFMASVLGAFGAAYAAYEPAQLHLADYDKTAFGGNNDGLISTTEAKNWDDRKFQDTAFDRLSSERKAGLVAGATVGAALYIWNIFDARARAHDHNRDLAQRRVNVGLLADGNRAGITLGLNF